MTIVNHTNQEKCEVKYHSYSYFTRERQRKVKTVQYIVLIVYVYRSLDTVWIVMEYLNLLYEDIGMSILSAPL